MRPVIVSHDGAAGHTGPSITQRNESIMSNITRHTVRRGNNVSKSASRKARAAAIHRADRGAYSRADRAAILANGDQS